MLVEVHDEDELETALEVVDADVIGINNRDLVDFTVDVERTYELLSDVPAGKTVVSESGFHTREQIEELERVGVDAVLIGETLMRAPDPEAALRDLCGHGEGADEPSDLRRLPSVQVPAALAIFRSISPSLQRSSGSSSQP